MAITRSRSRSLRIAQTGGSNSKKRRRTASSNSRKKQRTGATSNSRKKPKKSGSNRDWTLLPQGPLSLISEQLQSEIDVVRFRSVCTSWRSAAPRRQSPWFLAISGEQPEFSVLPEYSVTLFSLSSALIPETPMVFTRTYCSSYGWLASLFCSPQEKIITIFNPITRDHIVLPVVTGLDSIDYGRMRLILSSNPATTSDYTVAAILCNAKLAMYTSGDEAWSLTEFPKRLHRHSSDVAFYRGLIYVAGANRILVFDPAAKEKFKFVRATPIPCISSSDECCLYRYDRPKSCGCLGLSSYLVESCGDLLLVRKRIWNGDRRCEILQLQFCGRRLRGMVKKMESLGDHRALFLGRGCSFSLSVTMFPEYKGNHIYFVSEGDGCICVFSVADGKVERVTSEPEGWAPNEWFRPHLL